MNYLSTILILFYSFLLLIFVSCNSKNENAKATLSEKEQLSLVEEKAVKVVLHSFCKAIEDENFKEMIKRTDNETKNILIEYENNNSIVFSEVIFNNIESCTIEGNIAKCLCSFDSENNPINVEFELRKFIEGWKIHLNWTPPNINPFLIDLHPYKKQTYPGTIPSFKDTLERDDFLNAFQFILDIVNFPDNVIGLKSKYYYKNNVGLDTKPNLSTLYTKLVNATVNEKEHNILVLYNDFNVSVDYLYNTKDVLYETIFTISVLNENQFEYIQEIGKQLTQKYGAPFNGLTISESSFYQYNFLSWLIKGCNEIMVLEQEEYYIKIYVKPALFE